MILLQTSVPSKLYRRAVSRLFYYIHQERCPRPAIRFPLTVMKSLKIALLSLSTTAVGITCATLQERANPTLYLVGDSTMALQSASSGIQGFVISPSS